MGKRGRISAAELTLPSVDAFQVMERQKPPHDLNDEETEVWAAVVNERAADWFSPSTVPLLAQYCRHVVQARRISEILEKALSDKHLEVADYDRLLKMQERESRAIASLATKMRLTQQSITNHRGNKISITARKLWEFK